MHLFCVRLRIGVRNCALPDPEPEATALQGANPPQAGHQRPPDAKGVSPHLTGGATPGLHRKPGLFLRRGRPAGILRLQHCLLGGD